MAKREKTPDGLGHALLDANAGNGLATIFILLALIAAQSAKAVWREGERKQQSVFWSG